MAVGTNLVGFNTNITLLIKNGFLVADLDFRDFKIGADPKSNRSYSYRLLL